MDRFLDLCVSSLRRGHANLLCIVPNFVNVFGFPLGQRCDNRRQHIYHTSYSIYQYGAHPVDALELSDIMYTLRARHT